MFMPHLQVACMATSTLLLASWGADQWRRQLQRWEAIAARVRPLTASSSAWAGFRSAGVAMELADYAERRCKGVDAAMIGGLRADAIRTRVAAARAMMRGSGSNRG